MISIAGILFSLALLTVLAYRGVSVLILAPLLALLAALFSLDAPLLATYTQVFMAALGGFVIANGDRRAAGRRPRHPGGRDRVRGADLRRRVALCGRVRGLPERSSPAPRRGHPQASDPGDHRARCVHVHHDGAPRNAVDPERDTDIFAVAVAMPLLALVTVVVLGSTFGSF